MFYLNIRLEIFFCVQWNFRLRDPKKNSILLLFGSIECKKFYTIIDFFVNSPNEQDFVSCYIQSNWTKGTIYHKISIQLPFDL